MRAVNEVVEEQVPETPPEPPAAPRRRADLWSLLSYLALAVLVMSQLWRAPNGRVLSGNKDDHGLFLTNLAYGERVVFHGANPFHNDVLNAPAGVNMMAQTSIYALNLPLAPVTHFFGAGVTAALILTFGLFATAAAWYWVLSRHLVRSRVAAWIGGLWCGFAPAMISHANGHLNFANDWLIPFIVLQVLRLREPGRAWRGGSILAVLIVVQIFINEEALLFAAIALAVFVVAYAIQDRARAKREARHLLAGLGVAALIALPLLAYPLWYQFTRFGHYHGQPFAADTYVTDLAAIGAYARQSLAGNGALARALSPSATEDDSFFGPFGLAMIITSVVVLRRSVAARSAAIAALALLIAALGTHLRVGGVKTKIPLPFLLVHHLPVIDLVSVIRFAMVTSTIAGVLLALATDRLGEWPAKRQRLFRIGLVLALVPLFPKPVPTRVAEPLPAFLTQGTWKHYVTGDETLVPVPLPEVTTGRDGMRWAALSNFAFPVPRGYFMGPADPPGDLTGSWNAPHRYTSDLLRQISLTGAAPVIDDYARQQFRTDLRYWRAGVVVLVPGSVHGDVLLSTLTAALGTPRLVGGVEIWDVRSLS